MKPIEAIIASYLGEYPELKALHNGQASQGIADQAWKAPYQTVFLISDNPEMKRLKVPASRLQINSFAISYGLARKMAELTYQALDSYSGMLDGVTVERIIYLGQATDYETDTKLYNVQTDFMILYHQ